VTGPGEAGSTRPIRVMLADDHTLFRDGVQEMLQTVTGIEVVGAVSTGDDALVLAEQMQPDVLLLDVEMPGPGAVGVIRQLRRRCPGTRVIVLTMHDDAAVVRELLECGASAYLSKTSLRVELVAAVQSVAEQRDVVLLSVSRRTLAGLEQSPSNGLLTARELGVLRLTAQALSNGQIGTRLNITPATVKRHLTNIYAKLGAVSRVDAIRRATAAGLLGPEDQSLPPN
jgi:DNA-binding NarL/FixJ family response regulator